MICLQSANMPRMCRNEVLYPIMTLVQDVLRLIPVAVLHRTLEVRAMMSVQICEYPVLIFQAAILSLWCIADSRKAFALVRTAG